MSATDSIEVALAAIRRLAAVLDQKDQRIQIIDHFDCPVVEVELVEPAIIAPFQHPSFREQSVGKTGELRGEIVPQGRFGVRVEDQETLSDVVQDDSLKLCLLLGFFVRGL